jgi:hypothetical protein
MYFGLKAAREWPRRWQLFMCDPVTFLIVVLIFVPIVPISG